MMGIASLHPSYGLPAKVAREETASLTM
jgi:hypothetical protein